MKKTGSCVLVKLSVEKACIQTFKAKLFLLISLKSLFLAAYGLLF